MCTSFGEECSLPQSHDMHLIIRFHELEYSGKEIFKATTWIPRNNILPGVEALNLKVLHCLWKEVSSYPYLFFYERWWYRLRNQLLCAMMIIVVSFGLLSIYSVSMLLHVVSTLTTDLGCCTVINITSLTEYIFLRFTFTMFRLHFCFMIAVFTTCLFRVVMLCSTFMLRLGTST